MTAIDLRKPPSGACGKLKAAVLDMRSPEVERHMAGCDAVIHTAFAVMRRQMTPAEMRVNNVEGTLNVFRAARKNGIRRIINMSSVSVYGEGLNLTEEAPLNPSNKFPYAQHKAEIESIARDEFPEIIHLRSHLIAGRNAQPLVRSVATAPLVIAPKKPYPLLQLVHESDVAEAIMRCLAVEARGPYNLAASEAVSLPEFAKGKKSRFVVPVPLGAARFLAKCAKVAGSRDEFTWLDVLDTSLTVNCERAKRDLGWIPRSVWDARYACEGQPRPFL